MFVGPFTRCSAVAASTDYSSKPFVNSCWWFMPIFFFNLLPGLLDESLFMVTEKTRSLFVVYRFYLAYINTVNFILKMFANSRFQFDQLEELRSSLNLKALSLKWKCSVWKLISILLSEFLHTSFPLEVYMLSRQ